MKTQIHILILLLIPVGRVIPWYADTAHWFASEGRIDEKEFIEMSLTKKV